MCAECERDSHSEMKEQSTRKACYRGVVDYFLERPTVLNRATYVRTHAAYTRKRH